MTRRTPNPSSQHAPSLSLGNPEPESVDIQQQRLPEGLIQVTRPHRHAHIASSACRGLRRGLREPGLLLPLPLLVLLQVVVWDSG